MPAADPVTAPAHVPPAPLVGWRLLALFYDLWPALALWMLVAVPFVAVDTLVAGDPRHNIAPFSATAWLLWLACWVATGVYATVSWRRGGQTLGMRPWRVRLFAADGAARPAWSRLWLRYAVGTLSLSLGGLGLWWAWFDRDRLAWHDRASGTRLRREPRPARTPR